jgi:DNA-binding transcriptional MerR regulator
MGIERNRSRYKNGKARKNEKNGAHKTALRLLLSLGLPPQRDPALEWQRRQRRYMSRLVLAPLFVKDQSDTVPLRDLSNSKSFGGNFVYTVKQVAEKMGISAHTLRYYDKEGLFPHVSRDENNVRLFSEQDLEWVFLVQCLRDTGMPLAQVKEYIQLCLMGDSTIPTRYQLLLNQVQKAEQELATMEKRIHALRRKVEYYNGLLAERKEDDCNPMNHARTKEQPKATGKRSSSMPA